MSVLVDTSVWVSHFRQHNLVLVELLKADLVLTHPLIPLELACGTPPAPRQRTLAALRLLRQAQQPSLQEVADLIRTNTFRHFAKRVQSLNEVNNVNKENPQNTYR
jgi:predicted nucleic acid-binding protein